MLEFKEIYECSFTGPLASEPALFLTDKRYAGYGYNVEAKHLQAIDRLSVVIGGLNGGLSRELVDAWTRKRGRESHKTWSNRVVVMRQLVRFFRSRELEAFEPTVIILFRPSTFNPHIYTDSELRRIFEQADLCRNSSNSPHRSVIMPLLLFRLLYGCGLRISEALKLKVKDVDLDKGVLSILNSKFENNRLVPVAKELNERSRFFASTMHTHSKPDDIFFRPRTAAGIRLGQWVTFSGKYCSKPVFLIPARGRECTIYAIPSPSTA